MAKRSIFILLPDGVGLRNFAYGKFPQMAQAEGFDVTFWNNTPFDLTSLGFNEIKIHNASPRPMTDLLKRARSIIDLDHNIARSDDRVYNGYRQKSSANGIKNTVKLWLVRYFAHQFRSAQGLGRLRQKIKDSERKSAYYAQCLETLKREKPDVVFCTNQRPLTAISPILAAQDLGIPTVAFIFSWDNVPKATMVIEADHYLVWSTHMKAELRHYYPYIPADKIIVTGTPQFEPHFDASLILSREEFFTANGLDLNKEYICFSGDDITTSPNDPQYLADLCVAVRELNNQGHAFGILFRRCPVDFSNRFDAVLDANKDIIVAVNPAWAKMGESWNAVLPMREDMALQANTIAHTKMVVNLGSSMVFDYVSHGKPCAFLNYDPVNNARENWSVKTIYNYVHFRSMPDRNAVVWINDPSEMAQKLLAAMESPVANVQQAGRWFEIVNEHPVTSASQRIVNAIKSIL